MSVLNQNGEEQKECPLCMEPFEVDDLNFYPCTCGYQICRFCWHRIRTDENGLCPACRKPYSEDPADFTPLSKEQVAQLKAEKRARDQQRKARLSESRKHLASVRVVQKNLVFVVGLPVRLADADVLRRHEYFGKFGKIHKVVINQSTSYAGSQGPSASAYVTYYKSEDALRAIQSVNNITLDGRLIKSSLGTTKYCSHFMKNQPCPKPDCMYLHDLGDTEASFTKDEMHQGKHQEYEKRLHDALAAQTQNKTASGCIVQAGQNGTTVQKEAWPSLSRNGSPPNVGKERKSTNLEGKISSGTTLSSNNKVGSSGDGSTSNTIKQEDKNHTGQPPSNKTEKPAKTKNSNKSNKPHSNCNENIANNIKNTQNQRLSSQQTSESNKLSANNLINSLQLENVTEILSKNHISSLSPVSDSKSKCENHVLKDSSQEQKVNNDVDNFTSDDTDRSSSSSPLTQSLNKMTVYEDNTSFFSPNTFQKLISDNETSSEFAESNVLPQPSILNDSLPDINSSEDWEAAFGFSNKSSQPTANNTNAYSNMASHSIESSPQSSSSNSTPMSIPNTRSNLGQEINNGSTSFNNIGNQFGNSVSSLNSHINQNDVINNRNSLYNASNETISSNAPDMNLIASNLNNSVFATSDNLRNSIYNTLGLQANGDQSESLLNPNVALKNQIATDPLHVINGLDQNTYKFFSDFHKNLIKDHQPAGQQDLIANGFAVDQMFSDNSEVNRHAFLSNGQSMGSEHILSGPSVSFTTQQLLAQQQHSLLLQQRMMEKHLNDQQLLNLKNQQNGHQSPLLTSGNQQNFLNHGGYQQNFLLQNQINLVQNQHNLISGDQHNINLIGTQQNITQHIIGNSLANQHSNLLSNGASNPLLAARLGVSAQNTAIHNLLGQQNQLPQQSNSAFNQFSNQNQASQHLINNGSASGQSQQRSVDDDLGFDPFHETQKALAELMESEQVISNQQQPRARLPPPGFSHMNSFGTGLPRPHGSKILTFMGLGQTNSTYQPNMVPHQTGNPWPMAGSHSSTIGQNTATHQGLGVSPDWTTLDPAILTTSRHFPLVTTMAVRDQYNSNLQGLSGGNGGGNNGSSLRGDFTSPGHQPQPTPNLAQMTVNNSGNSFNSSLFQQQHNAGQFTHLTNGYSTNSQSNPHNNWVNNTADYQNQIPMPPGFRQNNQQGKTQEC